MATKQAHASIQFGQWGFKLRDPVFAFTGGGGIADGYVQELKKRQSI